METAYKTGSRVGYNIPRGNYRDFDSDYLKSFRDLRYKESKEYKEIKG